VTAHAPQGICEKISDYIALKRQQNEIGVLTFMGLYVSANIIVGAHQLASESPPPRSSLLACTAA
jgi:hypothetical protein